MTDLLRLMPGERSRIALPAEFLNGTRSHMEEREIGAVAFPREIELTELRRVIGESMTAFAARPVTEWDGWLAPRVHACLRITPREAADRGLWRFLAVAAFPDYVRARWRNLEGLEDRFLGPTQKQALARLWWGAELMRNGRDYTMATRVYRVSDLPNSWQVRLFRNRPMALAVADIATRTQGHVDDHGDRARDLIKSANLGLRSTVLDALLPYGGPDLDVLRQWTSRAPDASLMLDALPVGPDELAVPDAVVERAISFLRRIATSKTRPLFDAFDATSLPATATPTLIAIEGAG